MLTLDNEDDINEAGEADALDPNPVGEQQASDTAKRGNAPNGPTYDPINLALYFPGEKAMPFGSNR